MSDLTTLVNLKSWLKLSSTQTTDDTMLSRLISASSSQIQNYINRNLLSQTYSDIIDGQGNNQIVFANYPATAVANLSIDTIPIPASPDGGVLQAGYGFDDGRLWVIGYTFTRNSGYANDFTRGTGNVRITYTAGYATVPLDIEQTCIELASLKYRMRDRVGMNSVNMGGESTSFDMSDIPKYIRIVLDQYKKDVPL